jgi:hypothetical protein
VQAVFSGARLREDAFHVTLIDAKPNRDAPSRADVLDEVPRVPSHIENH